MYTIPHIPIWYSIPIHLLSIRRFYIPISTHSVLCLCYIINKKKKNMEKIPTSRESRKNYL